MLWMYLDASSGRDIRLSRAEARGRGLNGEASGVKDEDGLFELLAEVASISLGANGGKRVEDGGVPEVGGVDKLTWGIGTDVSKEGFSSARREELRDVLDGSEVAFPLIS